MTQAEIEGLLIELISQIQQASGRPMADVSPDTCPLLDIEGFDSLNGVEVTVDVLDKLKLELEFNNVLVDKDKPLTIKAAAARLAKISAPA
jgi:hypothetical protein